MAAKRMRGKPDSSWGFLKNTRITIDTTWLAKTLFHSKVRALGFKSASELMESLARGLTGVPPLAQGKTIAKLIIEEMAARIWTVEELAQELDLELERVDKLLIGEPAEMPELIALQTILTKPDGTDYDLEDLIEINQGRKTNGKRQSVECDY